MPVKERKIRTTQRKMKVQQPGSALTTLPVAMKPDPLSHEGMVWPEFPEGTYSGERERSGTRVLLMPAFNELSGFDVLKIAGSPTSPISRSMNRESCEIYLADGTYIGPLSSVEDD
jgi:metallophosphoesterase superfamily enzyme